MEDVEQAISDLAWHRVQTVPALDMLYGRFIEHSMSCDAEMAFLKNLRRQLLWEAEAHEYRLKSVPLRPVAMINVLRHMHNRVTEVDQIRQSVRELPEPLRQSVESEYQRLRNQLKAELQRAIFEHGRGIVPSGLESLAAELKPQETANAGQEESETPSAPG